MELVTECRQSGLSDAAWCNEHGISSNCFHNAFSHFRKNACQVPESVGKASALDLASYRQDVVKIAIELEETPAELFPSERNSFRYPDNHIRWTYESEAKGLLIRTSNAVQPVLLKILMDALKELLC